MARSEGTGPPEPPSIEMTAGAQQVRCRDDGPVRWITINRPDVRNALTFQMYEGLIDACESANTQGHIRALIIKGKGGSFAAGTDVRELAGLREDAEFLEYERLVERAATAVEAVTVPTIAAVDGACTGGGAVIAVACDLRIVSKSCRFGLPMGRTLGNCLSLRNYARIAYSLGPARAARLVLQAELISAEELMTAGFALQIVDSDDVTVAAANLAEKLCHLAPLTLAVTKQELRLLRDRALPTERDEELILTCYSSADFREGVEAFLAKRPPQWSGR